jgi:hypothetical protein
MTYIEGENVEHFVFFRNYRPKNPYNISCMKNLKAVFGSPYFLFLIGSGSDNGYSFERSFHEYDWPPLDLNKIQK